MPVEPAEFRRALGHCAATVTVVTTAQGQARQGITVTSFCSLSLHPPLVLVCIDKRARIHDSLRTGAAYAVNFLSHEQENVSRSFASSPTDPFDEIQASAGVLGMPLIDGAVAAVECTITERIDSGDHTIFVGQVEATRVGAGDPLLYCRGRYGRLAADDE